LNPPACPIAPFYLDIQVPFMYDYTKIKVIQ